MKTVNLAISFVSIITCLIFAYFLLFTDLKEDTLYGNKRIILSIIFIVYALLRMYRAYKQFKTKDNETEIE
jgi:flagellar biosynthesis protein FliQ